MRASSHDLARVGCGAWRAPRASAIDAGQRELTVESFLFRLCGESVEEGSAFFFFLNFGSAFPLTGGGNLSGRAHGTQGQGLFSIIRDNIKALILPPFHLEGT
jgi:hypothetical protein